PFINNAGKVLEVATPFPNRQTCFVVFKYALNGQQSESSMRVYSHDQNVDEREPTVWTVYNVRSTPVTAFHSIRVHSGEDAVWQIDELKIGRSWSSVVPRVE
ncbi:MAG: iron dicitrate transport regulator FecR, partial [Planctomycetota bacterium]